MSDNRVHFLGSIRCFRLRKEHRSGGPLGPHDALVQPCSKVQLSLVEELSSASVSRGMQQLAPGRVEQALPACTDRRRPRGGDEYAQDRKSWHPGSSPGEVSTSFFFVRRAYFQRIYRDCSRSMVASVWSAEFKPRMPITLRSMVFPSTSFRLLKKAFFCSRGASAVLWHGVRGSIHQVYCAFVIALRASSRFARERGLSSSASALSKSARASWCRPVCM